MSKHRVLATAAFVVTVGLIANRPVGAQQTTEGNGIPVHTVVTVEPQKGSEIPVINPEDVMVFEGKDRDKVVDWIPAQGDHAALELYVLLDDGSNMTLGTQLDSIKKFITEQPPTTKVGVAYMQNGIARIEQDLTTDHEQAANKVRLPMGIRGANASPYFSVSDLVKKWPATNARREVIVASDGIDPYYFQPDLLDPYLDAAISDAQRAGIIISAIYTPGIGHFGHSYWMTYWGQLYLAELAEKTGGEGYYIGMSGPPVSFSPYLNEASDRFGHQYLLTFLAKPPKKAGLQAVKIKTEVPHVDLVAPRQVYVPAGK
jgi:hypothetical protein